MNTIGIPEDKIREALFFLDYEDRDTWLMAGMCIKHELGDAGLDMWLSWSSLGSTYNQKHCLQQWKSFKNFRKRTIGTLIYKAMEIGFKFSDKDLRISQKEQERRKQRQLQMQAEQEAEALAEEQLHAKTANKAKYIWSTSKPCDSHPYTTKKDIMTHGCRTNQWKYKDDNGVLQTIDNCLIVPLLYRGELVSLQAIAPYKINKDGKQTDKFYMWGAKKKGVYAVIGDRTETLLLCEGWATGATLHEATQLQVYIALDSGNLFHVAKELRKAHPLARIVICADNDQYKKINAGIRAATKAAIAVDADMVYPKFKNPSTRPTDFNDLYNECGSYDDIYEIVVSRPTFKKEFNNSVQSFNAFDLKYVDEYKKVLEESRDPFKVACAALFSALTMSRDYPVFCSLDDIRNYIHHPLIHHNTHLSIMSRVQWSIYNRKEIAMSAIRPKAWGNKHEHVIVNSLDEYKPQQGVSLVFAPMGSGKTQRVIKPFSMQENRVFAAIAHRRSLISELSKQLKVENYEEAKGLEFSEKVAVCLPSAMSTRFEPFTDRVQDLAIDEISQNIRFTSSKECNASGVDQEGVYLGLKKLVNQSDTVIAADASIDQLTIDFMESARPDESFTIVEQVPQNKNRYCYIHDEEQLLSRVQAELLNGGNVWFAVESVSKAEAIESLFKENYDVLLITSKNSTSKKVKDFLKNVNKESCRYNLVVASPAISSGVSVEHDIPHFTMIAGIASGAAICFSDFAQMLGRVRYVPHYHVCLKRNNHRFENITANTILLGQKQAAMLEGGNVKENDYSSTVAQIDALERAYRSDFAAGFVWFMQYYCFDILPSDTVMIDYAIVDQLKEISKANREQYRRSLCNADPITKDEAEALDKKPHLNDDEQINLMAYHIKTALGYACVHQLEELDIDVFEKLPSLDRFARYLGLKPKKDDSEKNIALRRFNIAQEKAIKIMLGDADLKETFFTNEKCKEIITRCCANENRFMFSALKIVPSAYARDIQDKQGNLKPLKPPSNCANAMGRIVEKFGLQWKRKTKGYSRSEKSETGYMITEDSYNLMKVYAERRYAC